jgi:metal-dependent HD superfamily phosphatase/phosphodiesterase
MKIGAARKEELDRVILGLLTGKAHDVYAKLCADRHVTAWQNQANHVSIVRLKYNDHGPVHMRIVTLHALRILELLRLGGVQPSLVAEKQGSYDDAQVVVLLSAMLHDLGMAVTRQHHEWHSLFIGMRLTERYLEEFYPEDFEKQVAMTAMVQESIVGHMAHDKIHSVEAGTVLFADGTDMTKGRARIAKLLATKPTLGDMHRHSADAIKEVLIGAGEDRPVRVGVHMDDYSGIFQVEEVLLGKLLQSPIRDYVELTVIVRNEAPRRYL